MRVKQFSRESLAKQASIIGSLAAMAPAAIVNSAVGSSINDIPKLLLRKGNKAMSFAQKTTLADGVVALKKASQGQSMSNGKFLGMFAHGHPNTQAKTVALSGFNQDVMKHPFITEAVFHKERPNLLNVDLVKQHLSEAKTIREGLDKRLEKAKERMVSRVKKEVPTFSGSQEESRRISSRLDRFSRLADKVVSPARQTLDGAHSLHQHLSSNDGHGYELLRGAAQKAEVALNRPKPLNIMNGLYEHANDPNQGRFAHKIRNFWSGIVGGQRKHTPGGPTGAWKYINEGHPDDKALPAASILAGRQKAEAGILQQLNTKAIRPHTGLAGSGSHGRISREDVIESIRNGSALAKAKDLATNPRHHEIPGRGIFDLKFA